MDRWISFSQSNNNVKPDVSKCPLENDWMLSWSQMHFFQHFRDIHETRVWCSRISTTLPHFLYPSRSCERSWMASFLSFLHFSLKSIYRKKMSYKSGAYILFAVFYFYFLFRAFASLVCRSMSWTRKIRQFFRHGVIYNCQVSWFKLVNSHQLRWWSNESWKKRHNLG